MQAYLIRDISAIDIAEPAWNRIAAKSETNTIFQTYQWFHAWWKLFGGQHKLFFISVYDANSIIGIAPLMISTDTVNGKVLRFVGDEKADYCDFIISDRKEAALRAIFETISLHDKEWDSVLLNNVPERSSTGETVNKFCADRKFRVLSDDRIICPALLIKEHEQFADKMSNKGSLRRRSNYFKKNGRLSFFHVRSTQEANKYLPLFFKQHIERRDITEYPSLFLNDKNRAFYEELLSSIIHTGWLLFSVVEFNNTPIAFHYGFQYNSTLTWYKPSFDISYSKRSPGKVLLQNLIKYSIANGIDELDFTVGDEPFKGHFANMQRRNIRMMIYRNAGKYVVAYVKHHAKRVSRNMTGFGK